MFTEVVEDKANHSRSVGIEPLNATRISLTSRSNIQALEAELYCWHDSPHALPKAYQILFVIATDARERDGIPIFQERSLLAIEIYGYDTVVCELEQRSKPVTLPA